MIVSSTTGKSMLDNLPQAVMHDVGMLNGGHAFDEKYMGNFSFWLITSHRGIELTAQELLAYAISFGVSSLAKRAGGFHATRLGTSSRMGKWLGDICSEAGEELGESMTRRRSDRTFDSCCT
ncbi:MAG: hypothetical protein GF309_03465 [Candidatus Lokiarchaeota archaeon]|nr:hypothetical protein [Candidatus Lokiarchaeota archaeon]